MIKIYKHFTCVISFGAQQHFGKLYIILAISKRGKQTSKPEVTYTRSYH